MINAIPTYQLSGFGGAIMHNQSKVRVIRDFDEPLEREHLKAHVQSGDYFGLLATDLDEISQIVSDSYEAQSIMIQHIIEDLLYLERQYRIIHK